MLLKPIQICLDAVLLAPFLIFTGGILVNGVGVSDAHLLGLCCKGVVAIGHCFFISGIRRRRGAFKSLSL
jgi:hypothetical protein